MFYVTKDNNHGLSHNPFKAIVAPRPIGWISTLSKEGVPNLAPYSFFNAIGANPDLIMFSSGGWKDSATNARDTGEFVYNYVGQDLVKVMNETSVDAPHNTSEFEVAGIDSAPSEMVKPARVRDACAALECKVTQIIEIVDIDGNKTNDIVVIGQVMGIYIDDKVITDGRFDVNLAKPVTRLGYMDFKGHDGIFELLRPDWKG
ncbi:MAG: flavin reductase [Hyphomicrobiales bacterium]|nr:MAG: flavin reductase [Hyphomicrobiales bacterium]